jgi:membrane protease YdiL (CAAX protease family)
MGWPPRDRLLFVLIGLLAGFCEESLFRGYLQQCAVARLGAVGGIIAVSSLFAALHLGCGT